MLLALAAALSGCVSGPEPLEGTVRYRDPVNEKGHGGSVIAVTTGEPRKVKGATTRVEREALGALVDDLEGLGLFALRGRAEVPAALAPGSIAVEAGERRFLVTIRDLATDEEARVFSRSAARIVTATQGGPRFTLGK
jgi:hypothetical protein